MKKLILLVATFLSVGAFAEQLKIVCTPTIAPGNINYAQVDNGLNRISSIEITEGQLEDGGYALVLNMSGTAGVGDKPGSATVSLSLYSAYGSALIEYNNSMTSKSTLENPFVRFEIENESEEKPFLAALTFSSLKDATAKRLLTSRYNCQFQK